MAVTLQDIAKQCKVSVQTASSIINKRGHLYREETCRKVLDTARQLGYRPNLLARGLRGASTQTLGVVLPGLNSSSISNAKLQSIERAARDRGYRLLIGAFEDDPERLDAYVQDFLGMSVDGLIYWASAIDGRGVIGEAIAAKKPIVVVEPPTITDVPSVNVDRELGGYLQIRHLHELGRFDIACLLTSFGNYKSQAKVAGIRRALAESNRRMDPDLCVMMNGLGAPPPDAGAAMVAGLLDAGRPFNAVLTLSDGVAMGVVTELVRRGIRVPEDIAVIGYDDDVFAKYTIVPLTTVHQPREIGDQVLELLIAQINGQTPQSVAVMVEPHLVVRESTAGPAAPEPQ